MTSSMGTGMQATVQRAPFFDMVDQHARVVLLINMVAREDHHVLGVAADDIQVLRHRIRRAAYQFFRHARAAEPAADR